MIRQLKRLIQNRESIGILRPWMLCAGAGSLVPAFLLLLSMAFPHQWVRIVGDDGSLQGHFPFGMCEPLTRTALVFVISTSEIYWSLAGLVLKDELRQSSKSRHSVADFPLYLGEAILLFLLPLLVMIWCLAVKTGSLPATPWGIFEGNHGPWRHLYDLRKLLYWTFGLPPLAGLLALFSVVVGRKTPGLFLLGASIVIFLALFCSHYWLIE